MLAAFSRGHRLIEVAPANIELHGNRVVLRGRQVEVFDHQPESEPVVEDDVRKGKRKRKDDFFKAVGDVEIDATDCAAIFIRTDPPFDEDYLTLSWILSFAEDQGVRAINSPRGLREANEHLYALNFPELCPETVITNSHDELLEFVKSVGGRAIAKPIDGHAGFAVVMLAEGDTNLNAIIDMLTLEGKRPIMAQRYLPEGVKGDKRLLMVDGVIRGGVRRVPQKDDHRGNVHVGGSPEACEITKADRAIEAALQDRLRADGLFFVGIDVIGDYLTEINVTSPTGIQEIDRYDGVNLSALIWDAIEARR